MSIVTILKQVPDAEARVRPAPDGIDLSGVTYVIDGMDEYGVEQALRLREGGAEGEIVALALGPERFEEALRTALAMGADRAVHLETELPLDPISQAPLLAQAVRDADARLVLVGGKQADWDSAALGPAVAEALGWPHADWTTELELEGETARLRHDSDDGSEVLVVPLPLVVTTQQGLNEPRYPTLPNIMKAKRKELRKVDVDEGARARTTVMRQEIQTRERLGAILDGAPDEAARTLVQRLADEAKVLS